MLGKPTIMGTRVSVELILELLADGWSEKQILESYQNLNERDLKAVFGFLKDGFENNQYLLLI